MPVVEVKHNQSLMDIALQEYGDVEGVFWLVEDNQLSGILVGVDVGIELTVRDEVINQRMKDYLSDHPIATLDSARGEGIGYWAIGKDFMVS